MRLLKLTALILSIIMLLPCLSGCGKSYLDATIYFEVDNAPVTLDPQVASSDIELMVVRNIFEGLLRKNKDGYIENGVCEAYEKDGLTYTFKIRKDAKWSDGSPISSYDFLFAFERAVNPDTKAPFVSRLFSVANAKEIYAGEKGISSLGVNAPDEYTLTIDLIYDDKEFLNTLTTSICMPCNEEFFEGTVGKYGLERSQLLTNGSYYVGKWSIENFGIRLYNNEEYTGSFTPNNHAVFFSIREETPLELMKKGTTDIAFINNSLIDEAQDSGLNIISFQNICWVMTLGDELTPEIKNAFLSATSEEIFAPSLKSGFVAADSLFPEILAPNKFVCRAGFTSYNLNRAKSLISAAVKETADKKFPKTTLYYYGDENIKPVVTAIVGHWQQNLSTFINIEASDSLSVLQSQLNTKNLPFAVFPITCKSASEMEYLSNFGVTEAGELEGIQTTLLEGKNLIPIAFENTNIVTTNSIKEISTECENGYIDFAFIIKED
ncbi:MAG: hypothetical protein IJZ75_00785 [Clostridia bacterium]|nr:hypothetical protein [Clostridia bacterium]